MCPMVCGARYDQPHILSRNKVCFSVLSKSPNHKHRPRPCTHSRLAPQSLRSSDYTNG